MINVANDRCRKPEEQKNMTTDQTPEDGETEGFKIASRKIESLLKRLADRGVCPCCAARALAAHAASLAEDAVGSADAAELFEYIADDIREHDVSAPDPTQTH
jgi:hypothetical protein